jgi:hypothetical protein
MRYFEYLKSRFPFYLVSGIVFGVAVFLLITGGRHNAYLVDKLDDMERINVKKVDVKKYSGEIDMLASYFRDNFRIDVTSKNADKFLFQAVDDLKTNLQNAKIVAKKYDQSSGKKELPVEIWAKMKSFEMIIDYTEYIESFRVPDYKIDSLTVSQDPHGEVILNVKGAFVMPFSGTGN